jgi:hypothetical protein
VRPSSVSCQWPVAYCLLTIVAWSLCELSSRLILLQHQLPAPVPTACSSAGSAGVRVSPYNDSCKLVAYYSAFTCMSDASPWYLITYSYKETSCINRSDAGYAAIAYPPISPEYCFANTALLTHHRSIQPPRRAEKIPRQLFDKTDD